MSKDDFDEFVKRQQAKQAEASVFDAKQELDTWLGRLNELHKQIEAYLKSYVDAGTAKLTTRDIVLNEEFSGPYKAPLLSLSIGSAEVTFTPIGTMLIGSKGRVDVQGPAGKARLVLVNKKITTASQLVHVTIRMPGDPPPPKPTAEQIKQIEWTWKISTLPPEMKFIDLTQDTFFEMILAVANA